MAEISLILGGARSGKTSRALALAAIPPHVYIATAQAFDDEMAERIARHREERSATWGLFEAPLDLVHAIERAATPDTTLLIDCLTLWLSNIMLDNRDTVAEIDALCAALVRAPGRIVMVSNEVGLGIVPGDPLSRRFRDEQGRLNQRIAVFADHVETMTAGLPTVLKGAASAHPTPKQLVERFYHEMWNRRDRAVAAEILAPDIQFCGSLGDVESGVDGVFAYVERIHAAFSDYTCRIDDVIVSDSRAAVRAWFSGIHTAETMGYPATSRRIGWAGMAHFTCKGGQIVDIHVLGDLDNLRQQLSESA